MNRTLTFLLLLVAFAARAQQTAYNNFEVQQAAEPQGGFQALNQFMAVNLRKPFLAEVANKKGLVILKGVVEPDGHIAEVSVARSLRPDCDREAIRVFSRFNAWKPAQKDGKAVRQQVTFPIQFRATEPVQYEDGIAVRYFNNAFQSVASPDSAVIRFETPTDTLGIPTGNLVFFKRDNKKWKKDGEMEFFRNPVRNPVGKEPSFMVGHRDATYNSFGSVYTVDKQGVILEERVYNLDRKLILSLTRSAAYLVTRLETVDNGQSTITTWHDNGQLQYKMIHPPYIGARSLPDQMLVFYDSTGTQLVNEGNGQVTIQERVRSVVDTNQYTVFTEQGLYEKGLKQGRWTGQHTDGSHWYEEQYDKGLLTIGKSTYAGQADTLTYNKPEQQPEFKGGMQALNQFLGSNIRYPAEAQRARAQGRVFVSFVVCQDGSLCDFDVLKGFHPAADAEALRVVKAMSGQWKPGIQRGRPVRVKYNLPINFALN